MKGITLVLIFLLLLGACSSGDDGLTPEKCESDYLVFIEVLKSNINRDREYHNLEVENFNAYLIENGCTQRVDLSHCEALYEYWDSVITTELICSLGLDSANEYIAEARAELQEGGCATGEYQGVNEYFFYLYCGD